MGAFAWITQLFGIAAFSMFAAVVAFMLVQRPWAYAFNELLEALWYLFRVLPFGAKGQNEASSPPAPKEVQGGVKNTAPAAKASQSQGPPPPKTQPNGGKTQVAARRK